MTSDGVEIEAIKKSIGAETWNRFYSIKYNQLMKNSKVKELILLKSKNGKVLCPK